jgi:large subunit ribosomal protein L24e
MAEKCIFCGETIERGRGKFLVKRDGSLHWFCSNKCEKNQKLGRSPLKTRWTKTYRKFIGKITKAEEIKEAQAEAEKKAEQDKDKGTKKTPTFKDGEK